jgi:KaiC/GvpD/RAD55 family RecA-like ATPase
VNRLNEGNILPEMKAFFQLLAGQTLLIRGQPGTGKTILTFEILKEICDEQNELYVSTRINPDKLYKLFPWIKDVVPTKNIVNATPSKVLKAIGSELRLRRRSFDFGSALDFFKMLYDDAEEMNNPMVVIDSWDAVLNYINLEDKGAALTQSLCEFCHEVGTHLILVSESSHPTALDYIVDGVVTLSDIEVHGEAAGGRVYSEQLESRTTRQIGIDKLRGVKREQKNYVFTLENGRFRFFPPYHSMSASKVESIPDIDENHRSSGIRDMDLISGGLEKCGLTLFVVEHGVGLRYVPFLDQIAMNLSAANVGVSRLRSVGATLSKDYEPTRNIDGIYPFKPKTWLTWRLEKLFPTSREYMDFLEITKKEDSEIIELSLMESRKEYLEFLEQLRKKHSSVVEFLGLDTLETLYGAENTLKLVDEAIARAVDNREVLIAVAKRGMKSVEMITKLANTHFVFKDIVGSLFIYGVQPRTGLYNISSDESGINLTPVV